MAEIRLQRFLSQAGVASRRHAESMIQTGQVTVDGRMVLVLGTKVDPDRSDVRVDGERVRVRRPDTIALYKPAGCLTTRDDPQKRPTVMDLLPRKLQHLFPVGRLDWGTDGLLLLTSDGELANHLAHPRYGVERVYEVKVSGVPSRETVEKMNAGVRLPGGWTAHARVSFEHRWETNALLRIRLREGRTHEIKDLCSRVGHSALRITRIAYGPIRLEGLMPGRWRFLRSEEVDALRQAGSRVQPREPERERRHRPFRPELRRFGRPERRPHSHKRAP